MNKRITIVSFEGGEGSGKTTLAKRFTEYLQNKGTPTVLFRDPGNTEIGDNIRKILLSSKSTNMSNKTELLLYLASRAQLVHESIIPAVSAGRTVVLDRYVDSTLVYQGYARGYSREHIKQLNFWVTDWGVYMPNITFLLDVDPFLGLARSNKRLAASMADENRMELEGVSFHREVRKAYLDIARTEHTRVLALDSTNNDLDTLFEEICTTFKQRGLHYVKEAH